VKTTSQLDFGRSARLATCGRASSLPLSLSLSLSRSLFLSLLQPADELLLSLSLPLPLSLSRSLPLSLLQPADERLGIDEIGNTDSIEEQLLHRNVQQFRGGLVFKAHSLLYHSTLGLRVIKKKRFNEEIQSKHAFCYLPGDWVLWSSCIEAGIANFTLNIAQTISQPADELLGVDDVHVG